MFRMSVASMLFFASLSVGGCAKNQTATAASPPGASPGVAENQRMRPAMMGMGDQCPMVVSGTTVNVSDTSDGAAMSFTTVGDVTELRKRVHAMADRINAQSGGGMNVHGTMMGGDKGVRQQMQHQAQMMNQSQGCPMVGASQ